MKSFVALLVFGFGLASAFQDPCICTKILKPVCGSDGVTYGNPCMLRCKQQSDEGLTMVHSGSCMENPILKAAMCPCTREYMPLCGSDGVTYNNKCLFKCQQKQTNGLSIAHVGRCEDMIEKVAMCPCTREYMPLCGSDGVTYNNKCLFKCQQKQTNGLSIAHVGRCEDKIEAKNICPCPRNYMPVCGSDGVSYANPCLFRCEQKSNNALTVVHQGRCEEVEAPVCMCTMEWAPVCGSDGKTYGNMCGLKCQQKADNGLTVAHRGECNNEVNARSKFCTMEYAPVCGSDGRTYGNMCMFKYQQEIHNGLTLAHRGECSNNVNAKKSGVCTMEWAPVCGSDGRTYGNMCMFKYQQEIHNGLTLAHRGACSNNVNAKRSGVCTMEYAPVCGSDGRTYGNMCMFKYQQEIHNGLTLAHKGECNNEIYAKRSGICTLEYAPVCGSDGRTYGNMCMFKYQQEIHNGLALAHVGEC